MKFIENNNKLIITFEETDTELQKRYIKTAFENIKAQAHLNYFIVKKCSVCENDYHYNDSYDECNKCLEEVKQ